MNKLTIKAACEKYSLDPKKLIGHCLRNAFDDPLVVDRDEADAYLIADDWRLERLAKRVANQA